MKLSIAAIKELVGNKDEYAKFLNDIAVAQKRDIDADTQRLHEEATRMHALADEVLMKAQHAAKKVEDEAIARVAARDDQLDSRQRMLDRDETNFMQSSRSQQKALVIRGEELIAQEAELATRECAIAVRALVVEDSMTEATGIAKEYLAKTARLDAAMAS